jgi:hypothetical protein
MVEEVVLVDSPCSPNATVAALVSQTCEVNEENPTNLLSLQVQEIICARDERRNRLFHGLSIASGQNHRVLRKFRRRDTVVDEESFAGRRDRLQRRQDGLSNMIRRVAQINSYETRMTYSVSSELVRPLDSR